MREILFRGKRYDDKNLILSDSIMQTSYGCVNLWHEGKWIEVIPRTVGQYTGLKDKNGTKIFEGDIVRVSRGKDIETGEIQYNKYGVWVIVYDKFYCNTFPYIFTSSDSNVWIKVIGNIHDNPELLNAEDSL